MYICIKNAVKQIYLQEKYSFTRLAWLDPKKLEIVAKTIKTVAYIMKSYFQCHWTH